MWVQAIGKAADFRRSALLRAILAALLLLMGALALSPAAAQENTPTASATETLTAMATITSTPTPAFTCVFDHSEENFTTPIYKSPTREVYVRFPASDFIRGAQAYSDPNCQDEIWIDDQFGRRPYMLGNGTIVGTECCGGMAHAGDRDRAWDICEANNSNKVVFIHEYYSYSLQYFCSISSEAATPGGSSTRYLNVGHSHAATADLALTRCQRLYPWANAVRYMQPLRGNVLEWHCLLSWTAERRPILAPKPGCVNIYPGIYILFPSSNILYGSVSGYGTNQCDSAPWTFSQSGGYIFTTAGQSAAEALCRDIATAIGGPFSYGVRRHRYHSDVWRCYELPAPHNVTGLRVASADGAVRLNWYRVTTDEGQISGYRIWRRAPGKGETDLSVLVSDTGSTATSYIDSSVEVGQKYIYRVSALGNGKEGRWSSPVEIVVTNATATPTATATATATSTATAVHYTAVDGGVCMFHHYGCTTDRCRSTTDEPATGVMIPLYIKIPQSNFGPHGGYTAYADANCVTEFTKYTIWPDTGGIVRASDRDKAWELCEANNKKKLFEISHSYRRDSPFFGKAYSCYVGAGDPPPGGQSKRFMGGESVWGIPQSDEDNALAECRRRWPDAKAGDEFSVKWTSNRYWTCTLSWTVGGANTPTPSATPTSTLAVTAVNTPTPTATPTSTPVVTAIGTPAAPATSTPATTEAVTPVRQPGRASGLKAALSAGAVSLAWEAPAEGGDVTGYRIWRRLPDQGETELSVLVDNTGSAATSYLDGGAVAKQKRIYRVQALIGDVAGQQSPPVEIVIPTARPTATPTSTPTATPTDTPTSTPTSTPTATPTSTPTNTPTPAPKPGCVNVGPGALLALPFEQFLERDDHRA